MTGAPPEGGGSRVTGCPEHRDKDVVDQETHVLLRRRLAGLDEVLPDEGRPGLDALRRERARADVPPLGPGREELAKDAVPGREDAFLQGGG